MKDGVALTESDVLDYVHTPLRDLPLPESIPDGYGLKGDGDEDPDEAGECLRGAELGTTGCTPADYAETCTAGRDHRRPQERRTQPGGPRHRAVPHPVHMGSAPGRRPSAAPSTAP
ncbi:hypothetical protein Stsp01_13500 [Streptomyces sp. NBRC 13847]|nr:hypothetical protein Stsp01_13500 [Streptomyces sp. NBRC 13847]